MNTNQIKIEYNKNDEHFVNKPLYQEKKPIRPPVTSQDPKKDPTTFDGTKTLLQGTIPLEKINQNDVIAAKYMNSDLSLIKEEEQNIAQSGLSKNLSVINNSKNEVIKESPMEEKKSEIIKEEEQTITQSGLSKKISAINNSKNEAVKENPMEEKKPEEAFPVEIIKENSQENIIQKPITESGMSDFDSKLDHLPTINSIMKGKSEPLPPTKKNKYNK